jgi:hypothetical protein
MNPLLNATFNSISAISWQDEVPMQRQNIKIAKNNNKRTTEREKKI